MITETQLIDFRYKLMGALLTTAHNNVKTGGRGESNAALVKELAALHVDVLDKDPDFYAHLGAWYMTHGEVRDHKEMFVTYLLLSDPSLDLRQYGKAMLQTLPLYQVARIVKLLKKARKTPRMVRATVAAKLREMEANPNWFDSVAMRSAKDLKYLYAILRIAPSKRADAILFKGKQPEGSMAEIIKNLGSMTSTQQALAIMGNKISWQIVVGAVDKITEPIAIAMINNMSPVEIVNNLAMLEKHGALESKAGLSLIKNKILLASTSPKVNPLKMSMALAKVSGSELDGTIKAAQQQNMDAKGRLGGNILLCVDRSPSQEKAIHLGKMLAGIIANQSDTFLCVAFDSNALRVLPKGEGFEGWTKAFEAMTIGHATSCGAPIAYALKNGFKADKVIMITDEEDNTGPLFSQVWPAYAQFAGNPELFVILTDGGYGLHERCSNPARQVGTVVSRMEFKGDYTGAMGILSFLKGTDKAETIAEIMDTPLPMPA